MDAVLPLIGVVIGAVLGGGVTYLLDRRREGRAATAALRLVVVELRLTLSTWAFLAKESAEGTEEASDWLISEIQKKPLKTTQWTTYQQILAASLSGRKWKLLADAYSVIGLVNETAKADLNPDERLGLPALMSMNTKYLDQAVTVLQRGTGPPVGPPVTTM